MAGVITSAPAFAGQPSEDFDRLLSVLLEGGCEEHGDGVPGGANTLSVMCLHAASLPPNGPYDVRVLGGSTPPAASRRRSLLGRLPRQSLGGSLGTMPPADDGGHTTATGHITSNNIGAARLAASSSFSAHLGAPAATVVGAAAAFVRVAPPAGGHATSSEAANGELAASRSSSLFVSYCGRANSDGVVIGTGSTAPASAAPPPCTAAAAATAAVAAATAAAAAMTGQKLQQQQFQSHSPPSEEASWSPQQQQPPQPQHFQQQQQQQPAYPQQDIQSGPHPHGYGYPQHLEHLPHFFPHPHHPFQPYHPHPPQRAQHLPLVPPLPPLSEVLPPLGFAALQVGQQHLQPPNPAAACVPSVAAAAGRGVAHGDAATISLNLDFTRACLTGAMAMAPPPPHQQHQQQYPSQHPASGCAVHAHPNYRPQQLMAPPPDGTAAATAATSPAKPSVVMSGGGGPPMPSPLRPRPPAVLSMAAAAASHPRGTHSTSTDSSGGRGDSGAALPPPYPIPPHNATSPRDYATYPPCGSIPYGRSPLHVYAHASYPHGAYGRPLWPTPSSAGGAEDEDEMAAAAAAVGELDAAAAEMVAWSPVPSWDEADAAAAACRSPWHHVHLPPAGPGMLSRAASFSSGFPPRMHSAHHHAHHPHPHPHHPSAYHHQPYQYRYAHAHTHHAHHAPYHAYPTGSYYGAAPSPSYSPYSPYGQHPAYGMSHGGLLRRYASWHHGLAGGVPPHLLAAQSQQHPAHAAAAAVAAADAVAAVVAKQEATTAAGGPNSRAWAVQLPHPTAAQAHDGLVTAAAAAPHGHELRDTLSAPQSNERHAPYSFLPPHMFASLLVEPASPGVAAGRRIRTISTDTLARPPHTYPPDADATTVATASPVATAASKRQLAPPPHDGKQLQPSPTQALWFDGGGPVPNTDAAAAAALEADAAAAKFASWYDADVMPYGMMRSDSMFRLYNGGDGDALPHGGSGGGGGDSGDSCRIDTLCDLGSLTKRRRVSGQRVPLDVGPAPAAPALAASAVPGPSQPMLQSRNSGRAVGVTATTLCANGGDGGDNACTTAGLTSASATSAAPGQMQQKPQPLQQQQQQGSSSGHSSGHTAPARRDTFDPDAHAARLGFGEIPSRAFNSAAAEAAPDAVAEASAVAAELQSQELASPRIAAAGRGRQGQQDNGGAATTTAAAAGTSGGHVCGDAGGTQRSGRKDLPCPTATAATVPRTGGVTGGAADREDGGDGKDEGEQQQQDEEPLVASVPTAHMCSGPATSPAAAAAVQLLRSATSAAFCHTTAAATAELATRADALPPPGAPLPLAAPPSRRGSSGGGSGGGFRSLSVNPLLDISAGRRLPRPVRVTVLGAVSAKLHAAESADVGGSDSDAEEMDWAAAAAAIGGHVYGVFHPRSYLDGGKCIEHGGELVSRSAFERVGGSSMAKWYRSIKVLPEGEALGKWLARKGLPLLKGGPRRSCKGRRRVSAAQGVGGLDGVGVYEYDCEDEGEMDDADMDAAVASAAALWMEE